MTSSYHLIVNPSEESFTNDDPPDDHDQAQEEALVIKPHSKRYSVWIAILLVLVSVASITIGGLACEIIRLKKQLTVLPPDNAAMPFGQSEGLSVKDVVVTLKTGHSVIWKRWPVHFENELSTASSLPRIENLLIYSDHEETFQGHTIIDALANVSDTIRRQHDFQPYFQQRDRIAAGDPVKRLKGSWLLDRFKFLPISGHAFRRFPEAKWFINVESDTYAFYPALFRLLESLSSDTQIMLGSAVNAGAGMMFAHGGSGYVLSNALLAATYGNDPNFEHRMDEELEHACCGDSVFARALFQDKHVRLHRPDETTGSGFTGETPYSQRFSKNTWCSPIYTFHHINPEEVRQLWAFEQQIWPRLYTNDTIRFLDAYDHFEWDFMRDAQDEEVVREGWENRSEEPVPEESGVLYDVAFCRRKCEEREDCWSWQWTEGECLIGLDTIRLGQTASAVHTSGVRMDRISAFRKTQWCEGRPLRN